MLIMPVLQEEFYDLSGKAKEFSELLELVRQGKYLSPVAAMTGRPALNRGKILHALFLKSLQNIPTTKALLCILRTDSTLRRLCGWDFSSDIPSEATFSRAFSDFSESGVLDRIHGELVKFACDGRLVGHQSIDSTQIENRERPLSGRKPKKVKAKKKRGR